MWKYVSRRIREPFERSANHFERNTTSVVNSVSNVKKEEEQKRSGPPCTWFTSRRCGDFSSRDGRDTNRKKQCFAQLNYSWISAITWSGAIVFGWYTSQLIHLKLKRNQLHDAKKYTFNNIVNVLQPYVCKRVDKPTVKIESFLDKITPTVHLVSNDHSRGESSRSDSTNTSSTTSDDLGDVLNSIENKLGLAAIESGQHQVGLNLLRSAATRHHAPALFNLGVCYENGLGVPMDEKKAMELYKSAATLQHAGALYNLGIYYGQGRGGLSRNIETATRLLRLAAVQGQQDAIDALKALDIDIQPRIEVDPWLQHHNPLLKNDNAIPTPSALFVENVNYSFLSQNSKTLPEIATVF